MQYEFVMIICQDSGSPDLSAACQADIRRGGIEMFFIFFPAIMETGQPTVVCQAMDYMNHESLTMP